MRLHVTADRDQLIDNSSELSFVTIELRDENGTLLNERDRLVTVEVSGAGTLQGLGSARPDSTEKFDSNENTSFDGRLLAIVRPTGVGPIVVDVSADGLEPLSITLNVAAEPTNPSDI